MNTRWFNQFETGSKTNFITYFFGNTVQLYDFTQ